MNLKTYKLTLRSGTAALAFIMTAGLGAHAEEGSKDTTTANKNSALEEIVVTAQKREQNLQDVASAATALSSSGLDRKAVEGMNDLQFASPSLSITFSGLVQSVNIRGVGIASGSPAVANGVATYIDGVFQPPIVTTSSFYDVGSVEVFRGPQGTFVGSNSTGGAVFINSRSPDLDGVNGYAEASVGNYGAYGFEGAINVPVSKTLAFRGAVNYQQRDSYFTDIGAYKNTPNSLDETAGRFGMLWRPDDHFQALFKIESASKKTGGHAYRPIPGTLYAAYRTNNIRTLDYDTPTRNDERGLLSTLELKYETAGGTTFRSVSGYQNKHASNLFDSDGTSSTTLPASTMDQVVRERVWTEEVNVISSTDTAFSWIVGGYFQRNRIDVDITQRNAGFPVDINIGNKKTTTGYFGQFTYKLNDQLAIDIGARYSHYSVTGDGVVAIGPGIPGFPEGGLPVADLSGQHSDGRMTGKVALNWTPDENNLIYAFVARGYKPGGFNSAVSEFNPETVIDYEAGWKSSFMDDHVRTQLGGFYYDYSGFQFDVVDPDTGQQSVTNLTDATIKGFEGQIQAQVDGFRFDGGFAYVDSSLGGVDFIDTRAFARDFPGASLLPQCPAGQASNPPTCYDYSPYMSTTQGGPNLFSPKWTYNLGVEYRVDIGDVSVTPRLNYAYVGPQYVYIGYSPISDLLKARGLLSALLTVDFSRYKLEFYGRNLTNKQYVSGQSGNNEFYGAPREYGVRLRATF